MKEEKAWWMKTKLKNYKEFLKRKLSKPMILTINFMNFQGKAKRMMNKLDFWGIKFKNKEEKVQQIKILSKSFNIF